MRPRLLWTGPECRRGQSCVEIILIDQHVVNVVVVGEMEILRPKC